MSDSTELKLFSRKGTVWYHGDYHVPANFVRDRGNQLEFENQELKQKIAELEASPPASDAPSTLWYKASYYVGLAVIAVFAALLGWLILRWLFSVNINLTSINLGAVTLLVVAVLMIPRLIRWVRSQRQPAESAATKHESTDSDQRKSARQWFADNVSANRGRQSPRR